MELKQHPLSAAFPSMGAEEFQALKDDIENHGQREPILLFEGMVLDGWHRFRACTDLGIKPKSFTFPDDGDPQAFVLSNNLHRRHMTSSQRAAAVVACAEWAPRGKPKTGTGSGLATDAAMAKQAQTSDRTIRDAKAAHRAGLTDAVKDGAITVKEAAKIARGKTETKEVAPKTEAAPAPAPTASNGAEYGPDAAEIAANEAADRADRDALQKLLDADDKLSSAYAEIKRLNAVVATQQQRINGLMNEKAEAIKSAQQWQRKYNKALKEAA